MRFSAITLAASVLLLGACGGGDKKAGGDSAGATAAAPAATTGGAGDTAAKAGAAGATGGAVAAKPATGATHEVKMYGDDKGYRFEPANLTVKQGDAVKFIMVNGGPHNVAFDPAAIPSGAAPQLNANMSPASSDESSPMLMNPNDAVTVSFAGLPAGAYNYHCTPHLAMNMKGVITVQ